MEIPSEGLVRTEPTKDVSQPPHVIEWSGGAGRHPTDAARPAPPHQHPTRSHPGVLSAMQLPPQLENVSLHRRVQLSRLRSLQGAQQVAPQG